LEELPDEIKDFIKESIWQFAKTYAKTWPHEYIVQERLDKKKFAALANHIDKHGYESKFYNMIQVYYDYDGHTYWHMGNIINRCLFKDTYQRRKLEGRLPASKE
jgi:hypothetical protein